MKARWIVAIAVSLLAGWWLWNAREPRGASRARTESVGEEAQPQALVPAPTVELEEPPAPLERVEQVPQATPSVADAAMDPRLCEIRGRFVLPGGAPAVGASFEVHGWESNAEDVERYGRPESWNDPSGETDADGRIAVRFEPPRAYQFTLEVKAPGCAGVEWRWGEILAGAVVDLGEIALVPGGIVEGRVVDEEGNAAPGSWFVYVRSVGLRTMGGREETQVITHADGAGFFRAEGVMPGRVELKAAHHSSWTEGTVLQIRSGETVTADIVVASRATSRVVTLDANWKRLHGVGPEPGSVSLTAADGTRRSPKESRLPWIIYADVEPGEYTLAIDDPRFRPWSRTVEPGDEVEAELEGTSSVRLTVRDSSGAPIESYGLVVELRNVNFSPHTFEVEAADLQLSEGLLHGLAAGDYRLVACAGEHFGVADVEALGPRETRVVEVTVGTECVVSGTVRYSDGRPASDVDVALLASDPTEDEEAFDWFMAHRVRFDADLPRTTTGEKGEFRVTIPRGEELRVCAVAPNESKAASDAIVFRNGETRDDLELVLPVGGVVAGRFIAPDGASFAGLRATVRSLDAVPRENDSCPLSEDGRFEIGAIPPGTASVYLSLPIQTRRHGGGLWSGGAGNGLELGTLEVVDGARIEREFRVAQFPGTATISVSVNGEPIAGLEVELVRREGEDYLQVVGPTDAQGRFGPALAFPGSWTVSVRDPDENWTVLHQTPIQITAASESVAQVELELFTVTVAFLDAKSGEPLAERVVYLLAPEGGAHDDFPLTEKAADERGRVGWKLSPGAYRFALEPQEDELDELEPDDMFAVRAVPFVWSKGDPATLEVRL